MNIFNILTTPIVTSHEIPLPEPVKKGRGRAKKDKKKKKPVSDDEPSVITHNMELTSLSDDEFWKIIEKLAWRNKDETVMNINNTADKLSNLLDKYHVYEFIDKFTEYEKRLHEIVNYTGPDKKQIYAHIIALGNNFYNSVLEESGLFYFILTEKIYQPFNEVINNII